jgi:archaellin
MVLFVTENYYSSSLRSLIDQYGFPTSEVTPRFRSLLQDIFVDNPREMNLLIAGLEEGIPPQLYGKKGTVPYEIISRQMVDRLNTNRAMERVSAEWVVRTWAEAIGYDILVPIPSSPINYEKSEVTRSSIKEKKYWEVLTKPQDGDQKYPRSQQLPTEPHSESSRFKFWLIIIVGFVLIIGLFSHVMLGAGFFAPHKVQEVTYSGIKHSTSSIIVDGFIYGSYDQNNGGLQSLNFEIKNTGDTIINLQDIRYLYNGEEIHSAEDGSINPGDNKMVQLDLWNTGRMGPMPGGKFSLEIKPPTGASTLIIRTLTDFYSGGAII